MKNIFKKIDISLLRYLYLFKAFFTNLMKDNYFSFLSISSFYLFIIYFKIWVLNDNDLKIKKNLNVGII